MTIKNIILGILVLVIYISYKVYITYPDIAHFSGYFEDENIELNIYAQADNRFGTLHINNRTFPVEGILKSAGLIKGEINLGSSSKPFTLSLPAWKAILPSDLSLATLSFDQQSYGLEFNPYESIDFAGTWKNFSNKLTVEKAEGNDWQGLLVQTNGDKKLITFRQIGNAIRGEFFDNDVQYFSGEHIATRNQIKLNIQGQDYTFTHTTALVDKEGKSRKTTTADMMKAYDGVYENDDREIQLRLSYRRKSSVDEDGLINTCSGTFKAYDAYSRILSCGVENGKLWFNYREYDDFQIAYINLTETGIDMKFKNGDSLALKKIIMPIIAGRYSTDKGTIIEFINLKEDIWKGYIYSLKGGTHPFQARFTANTLEGINLSDGNKYDNFVIDSHITTGVLKWNGGKPINIRLISKQAAQPHNPEQLKVIEEAYALYEIK